MLSVISIFFILLSITTFILQTTTFVQIVEFRYLDVYIGNNRTGKNIVRDLQRYDAIAGFDAVEWICKISS